MIYLAAGGTSFLPARFLNAKLGTKKDVRKLSSAKILSFSEQPINRGENKKRDN